MSLLFAATYPERASALVLYGSYARHPTGKVRPDSGPFAPEFRTSARTLQDEIVAEGRANPCLQGIFSCSCGTSASLRRW